MNHIKKLYEVVKLINNNLYEKLVLSLKSPSTFDGRFKVNPVLQYSSTPDFNLLICELDNLRSKCYIDSFYTNIIFKKILQYSHGSL